MTDIHGDFETYSEADLTEIGAHAYASHPSTDVLVFRYITKSGRNKGWRPGDPYPFKGIDPADIVIFAWNAQFERLIWNYVMVRRYGWPELALEQFVCVAAWARSVASAPAKLEVAAQFFGQPHQKDMRGHLHMLKMCRPAKSGAPRSHHTPENIDRLDDYCADDVEAEADIAYILPPWPQEDMEAFWESEYINDHGFVVDCAFAERAVTFADEERGELADELYDLTDGAVEKPTQTARFNKWALSLMSESAVKMTEWYDKGKKKNSFDVDVRGNLIMEDDLHPGFLPLVVRQGLEIMDEASKSTIAKYQAILNRSVIGLTDDNERVHGLYMYAGAAQSGRYSSVGIQAHNLWRDVPKEAPHLIDAFMSGDDRVIRQRVAAWADEKNAKLDALETRDEKQRLAEPGREEKRFRQRKNGVARREGGLAGAGMARRTPSSPIHALTTLVRPTIVGCAYDEFDLVWGDWSSIEARALPWLSLDHRADDILDAYRMGKDLYLITASRILGYEVTKEDEFERQAYGKVPTLSLGYGGGVGAFMAMARNYGVTLEEHKVHGIVKDWRETNSWATKFWMKVEDAAMWALKRPGCGFGAGRLNYIYEPDDLDGLGVLYCELPSGRRIAYPDAEIHSVRKPWGKMGLGITARKGAWRPAKGETEWPRVTLWYGLLVENATQAVCADLLKTALVRAPHWGLTVCAHTHDEIMIETPEPERDAPVLQELMETRPGWPGDDAFPLKAECKYGYRYKVPFEKAA